MNDSHDSKKTTPEEGYSFLKQETPESPWEAAIVGIPSIENFLVNQKGCGSTNDRAKDFLARYLADSHPVTNALFPRLEIAETQTGGRGQGNHRWWSPPGGIYLTLTARWSDFRLTREENVEFSLRVARAVAETVTEELAEREIEADVKPPNDVYVGGRKIAGILIESPNPEFVVVGMGINANRSALEAPEDIRGRVTSLIDWTGRKIDRPIFVKRLITRLLAR